MKEEEKKEEKSVYNKVESQSMKMIKWVRKTKCRDDTHLFFTLTTLRTSCVKSQLARQPVSVNKARRYKSQSI